MLIDHKYDHQKTALEGNNFEILCWGQVSYISLQLDREFVFFFFLREMPSERPGKGFNLHLLFGEVFCNTSLAVQLELVIECPSWNADLFI